MFISFFHIYIQQILYDAFEKLNQTQNASKSNITQRRIWNINMNDCIRGKYMSWAWGPHPLKESDDIVHSFWVSLFVDL